MDLSVNVHREAIDRRHCKGGGHGFHRPCAPVRLDVHARDQAPLGVRDVQSVGWVEGDPVRSRTAMDAATHRLVDDDLQIVRLFTPPFSETEKDPGYIKSYPPGVRENGGQYTHAATWFVIALAEMGRADEAYRVFRMLNPVNHAADEAAAEQYRVEPYVVAADIYSEGEKGGRGGWTWYTGSAGWLYRAAVEGILGIRRDGKNLVVNPVLPRHWDGYFATLRLAGATYRIRVARERGRKAVAVEIDGSDVKGTSFALADGGEVNVTVRMPA